MPSGGRPRRAARSAVPIGPTAVGADHQPGCVGVRRFSGHVPCLVALIRQLGWQPHRAVAGWFWINRCQVPVAVGTVEFREFLESAGSPAAAAPVLSWVLAWS
jgi:hypothetical protein